MLQHSRTYVGVPRKVAQALGFNLLAGYPAGSVKSVQPQPISFTCNGTGFDPTNLRRWLQNYQIVLQTSDSLPGILEKARKTDKSREVHLVPQGQTYVPQNGTTLFVEEVAELLRQLYIQSITKVSFPFVLVVSVATKDGSSALLSVHCAHDARVVIGRRVKVSASSDF